MGRLIKGQWTQTSIVTSTQGGAYARENRSFRDTVHASHPHFKPEPDRYCLYVSYACPWATRTLIYRTLKKLEHVIDVCVVHPDMLENGWSFQQDYNGTTGDKLYNLKFLYQLYQKAQPDITSSVTVPILWDKKKQTIVNNESSEIIRIFNSNFNDLTGDTQDYYPPQWRQEIDIWNEEIYSNVNNGVYQCGFARTQQAYDRAIDLLFTTLEKLDTHLENRQFLVGGALSEADIRLIPTLLRFDIVYYVHFKTCVKRIQDFKNLSRYTRELSHINAIRKCFYPEHIKRHYFYSHEFLNPFRIIAKTPSDIF